MGNWFVKFIFVAALLPNLVQAEPYWNWDEKYAESQCGLYGAYGMRPAIAQNLLSAQLIDDDRPVEVGEVFTLRIVVSNYGDACNMTYTFQPLIYLPNGLEYAGNEMFPLTCLLSSYLSPTIFLRPQEGCGPMFLPSPDSNYTLLAFSQKGSGNPPEWELGSGQSLELNIPVIARRPLDPARGADRVDVWMNGRVYANYSGGFEDRWNVYLLHSRYPVQVADRVPPTPAPAQPTVGVVPTPTPIFSSPTPAPVVTNAPSPTPVVEIIKSTPEPLRLDVTGMPKSISRKTLASKGFGLNIDATAGQYVQVALSAGNNVLLVKNVLSQGGNALKVKPQKRKVDAIAKKTRRVALVARLGGGLIVKTFVIVLN